MLVPIVIADHYNQRLTVLESIAGGVISYSLAKVILIAFGAGS